ncbi:HisA/HisF-related TIM barrel protein [Allorhodopirellula heiligendammensis]|nr:HisA/HisF-related TIM barrel protein [Allorhodopirellula heiligendammensis]
MADHLIGVIDLQAGVAVHGIAGNRARYLPVRPLWRSGHTADGNPLALADWYRQQFQIRSFYVADLDALQGAAVQHTAIESLISQGNPEDQWLIDIGMCQHHADSQTRWMQKFSGSHSRVDWIIASESAMSTNLITHVCNSISPASLVLGVDFRDGRFVGPDSGVEHWISAADQAGLRRGLVLDVAVVGTNAGPGTAELCWSLHQRLPTWHWTSGGGCRSVDDVAAFLEAGCDRCLIASALLPKQSDIPRTGALPPSVRD